MNQTVKGPVSRAGTGAYIRYGQATSPRTSGTHNETQTKRRPGQLDLTNFGLHAPPST